MNVPQYTSSLVIGYRQLLKQISVHYGTWDEQQTQQLKLRKFNLQRAFRRLVPRRQSQQPKSEHKIDENKQVSQQSDSISYAEPFAPNPTTSAITVTIFGCISKLITDVLSHKKVDGMDKFVQNAILREKGVPLITVANHVSAVDEPAVLGASVPIWVFMNYDLIRWVLCATDRCFKYASLVPFFKQAKTLPIERGKGIEQPGFQAAQQLLQRGEWIHMFPEGTRTKDGKIQNLKKGVGKLVCGCINENKIPLIVPIIHDGMENVFPKGAKIPQPFQNLNIIIGDDIDISDIVQMSKNQEWDEDQLSMIISKRIELNMKVVHAQLHENQEDLELYQEQLKQHKQTFSWFGEPGWQYCVFSQHQMDFISSSFDFEFMKRYQQPWKKVWNEYSEIRQNQLQNIVAA